MRVKVEVEVEAEGQVSGEGARLELVGVGTECVPQACEAPRADMESALSYTHFPGQGHGYGEG